MSTDDPGLVGTTIRERYEVTRLLGRGGMGSVYQVKDLQTGADRALKILESAQGGVRVAHHRFKREFGSISRLTHPHIVSVYDFGDLNGTPYYVMELLTANSLAGLIPRPADLPGREAILDRVKSLSGVVEALGAVHAQHLVHRDLKPSNILYSADGLAKITDFGLAKDFDGAITLTESGAILGTLSYMAPEQLQGRRVDHRADLYAFGIVLYQLATGRLPFTETNPLALMRQQVTSLPALPSRHNSAVPRELDDVILKLLARDPADRYPNAAALLADMRLLASGSKPAASRDPGSSSNLKTILSVGSGFVGRQEELVHMQKALETAGAGQGAAVLVTGEAGVGKTRFVEEFRARALLYGSAFLRGRADRRTGVFYRPFIDMIEACAARIGQYDTDAESAYFGDVGRVLARLAPRLLERPSVAALPEPPAIDPAENKLRLFDAVTRFLLRFAKEEPLVLFFDDAQHLDELSLELIEYLGRNARASKVLLIAACRGEELTRGGRTHPLQDAFAALKKDGIAADTIALGRLSENETRRLAEALAPGVELEGRAMEMLWKRTAGIPYFVEELVRWVSAQGGLERGAWPEEMPETVEAIVRERLADFPEEHLAALRSAAVVGEEFDFDLLLAASGEPEDRLLEAIDTALRRKVVEERGGERYAFSHPLLRMLLYSKLLPRKRRLLHAAVARGLEARGAASGREAVEALAYHWTGAGEKDRALDYALEAARHCQRSFANDAARQHFENVVRQLDEKRDPASTLKKLQVLEELHDVLMTSGSAKDGLDAANRCVLLATELADPDARARAGVKVARAEIQMGNYEGALGHLEEARRSGDGKARIQAQALLGFLLSEKLNRADEGLKHAEEAAKASEGMDDVQVRISTLNALGVSQLRAGRVNAAVATMKEQVAYARLKERRLAECNALNNLSVAYEKLDAHEDRVACLRRANEVAREVGNIGGECLYLAQLAWALLPSGSPDAEAMAERSVKLSRRTGFQTSLLSARLLQAELAYRRADFAASLPILEEIEASPGLNAGMRTSAVARHARILLHQGLHDDAIRLVRETISRVGETPTTWTLDFHVGHLDVLVTAGRMGEARETAIRLKEHVDRCESRAERADYAFACGRLAALLRDGAEAAECFKAATPVLFEHNDPYFRANARIEHALALYRLGRRTEARHAWLKAEEEFLGAGYQKWYEARCRVLPEMNDILAEEAQAVREPTAVQVPSGLLLDAPPLVGRDGELVFLGERLAEAVEKRAGKLVVYRGPTGIGKTRLVREFADLSSRRGVASIAGAGSADTRLTAYHVFVPVLAGALDAVPAGRIPPDVARTLRAGVHELAAHRSLASAPAAGADLSPEQERVRLQDACARLLELAAECGAGGDRAGLVVLLDDLGYADEPSLDLLEYLVRSTARAPLLIVATFNSDDCGESHPLPRRLAALARAREASIRDLGPLRADDIARLVDTLVGSGRKETRDLADLVADRSGGNPLFARELLLAMFREGLVEDEQDRLRLKTSTLALPDTIAGLLRRQLDGLHADAREALAAAGALGREFDFDTLMASTAFAEDRLLEALEGLVTLGVVEAVEEDPLGRDLYRFVAPQMREVVYADIEPEERPALHRRIGEALERAALNRKGVSASELAHHFVLGGGGRKGRDYSLDAGMRAARVCANAQAVLHLENAVRLMRDDAALLDRPKLFDALAELSNLRARMGEIPEALRLCDEAIAAAETAVQKSRVYRSLANAHHREGSLRDAVEIAERGLVQLCRDLWPGAEQASGWRAALPDPAECPPEAAEQIAGMLSLMAFDCQHLGRNEECRAAGEALAKFAKRCPKPSVEASAWKTQAYLLQEEGRGEEAVAAYEKSLSIYRTAGDRWGEAALLNNLAGARAALGDPHEGLRLYLESARVFGEVGDLVEHGRQLTNIGRFQIECDQWAEAEKTLTEALDVNLRLGERRSVCFAQLDLGRLHHHRGDRERAESQLRAALRLAEELGLVALILDALRLLSDLAQEAGDAAAAREWDARALSTARARGGAGSVALSALSAATTEAMAGDLETAASLLEEGRKAAGPVPAPGLGGVIAAAEAGALEARKDYAGAVVKRRERLATAGSSLWLTSMFHAELGRAQAIAGDGDGARASFRAAREGFEKLGAPIRVEGIRREEAALR
jgi:predicted ATPase/Tfp pilus assembly protein PilF